MSRVSALFRGQLLFSLFLSWVLLVESIALALLSLARPKRAVGVDQESGGIDDCHQCDVEVLLAMSRAKRAWWRRSPPGAGAPPKAIAQPIDDRSIGPSRGILLHPALPRPRLEPEHGREMVWDGMGAWCVVRGAWSAALQQNIDPARKRARRAAHPMGEPEQRAPSSSAVRRRRAERGAHSSCCCWRESRRAGDLGGLE